MNDQMPMFEDPLPTPAADAPKKPRKKPRKKPVKRRKARKAAVAAPVVPPVPKKRRMVRKARVINGHAGGRYTKAQYAAIGALMEMTVKERAAVFDIVKGLSK